MKRTAEEKALAVESVAGRQAAISIPAIVPAVQLKAGAREMFGSVVRFVFEPIKRVRQRVSVDALKASTDKLIEQLQQQAGVPSRRKTTAGSKQQAAAIRKQQQQQQAQLTAGKYLVEIPDVSEITHVPTVLWTEIHSATFPAGTLRVYAKNPAYVSERELNRAAALVKAESEKIAAAESMKLQDKIVVMKWLSSSFIDQQAALTQARIEAANNMLAGKALEAKNLKFKIQQAQQTPVISERKQAAINHRVAQLKARQAKQQQEEQKQIVKAVRAANSNS